MTLPVAIGRFVNPTGVDVARPGRRSARLLAGAILIGIIGLSALAAPWISPYAPEAQSIADRLQPPSQAHWFGTDAVGRDLLSRVLWGGRVSLSVGLLSMVIAVVASVAIGAASGFFGGRTDALLMRFTELIMVFPTFFLIILVLASFGNSVPLLIAVIGLTSWPIGARIVRGEVLKIKNRDFIHAAEALGATAWRVIWRHIIPNTLAVIVVSATIRVGTNILVEAGLSYLGLGVQPPLASWGNIVAEGARVIRTAWWVVATPAAAIFVTVLAFNLLGEGVRDAFDPRSASERPS
ncbi:MAG: ABC transporter permease [Dehalococcoidia bacterium]